MRLQLRVPQECNKEQASLGVEVVDISAVHVSLKEVCTGDDQRCWNIREIGKRVEVLAI